MNIIIYFIILINYLNKYYKFKKNNYFKYCYLNKIITYLIS